jgi:hypothetical protein
MSKIPFSRKKVIESSSEYWNQLNEFLAMSSHEDLSGDLLAFHYLYWIYSETCNGTLVQYFENKGYWNQDEVLSSLKALENSAYTNHFETAKLKFEKIVGLSNDFEENEDLIERLEDDLFELGIIYQDKPDALDFIESRIRANEEKYLEFID